MRLHPDSHLYTVSSPSALRSAWFYCNLITGLSSFFLSSYNESLPSHTWLQPVVGSLFRPQASFIRLTASCRWTCLCYHRLACYAPTPLWPRSALFVLYYMVRVSDFLWAAISHPKKIERKPIKITRLVAPTLSAIFLAGVCLGRWYLGTCWYLASPQDCAPTPIYSPCVQLACSSGHLEFHPHTPFSVIIDRTSTHYLPFPILISSPL